ncbi:unnamed protein product [Prorocentrum cordatum]|uniref:Uncharacterized protein n=1 Tax=Prorocentrum cordatum TaxID=2364126 RepID=A0ABN9UGD2_9DINO|nr:unnamed protein product [Polarella glacialis]
MLMSLRMFQIVEPGPRSPGAAGCATVALNAAELQVLSKTGELDNSSAFDLQEQRWVGMLLVTLKRACEDQSMERGVNISYNVLLVARTGGVRAGDRHLAAHSALLEAWRGQPRHVESAQQRGNVQQARQGGPSVATAPHISSRSSQESCVSRGAHLQSALQQALRPSRQFRLFLELLAGTGALAAAMKKKGVPVLAFDVSQGPHMDLLNDDVYSRLRG